MICSICGNEAEQVGGSMICLDCQSEYFKALEEQNGTHMAVFLTCGMAGIPCEPTICPVDLTNYEGGKWEHYIDLLFDAGKLFNGDKPRTFLDGTANIRKIFGRDLTEKDFGRYVRAEQERYDNLTGTEKQRTKWGVANYTSADYDELDRRFNNRMATYKGITVTPQMEDILTTVCKLSFEGDRAIEHGNTKKAKDLYDMLDKMLASENLRKKDEKPVENAKTDAFVAAMEKAGLMDDGQLLDYDRTVEALRDHFVKSKKYDYSLDACDQMINDYYNNLRANADLALVSVLPADMEVEDEYGEFEAEETEEEKKRKRYAGLTPVQFEKAEGGK